MLHPRVRTGAAAGGLCFASTFAFSLLALYFFAVLAALLICLLTYFASIPFDRVFVFGPERG